jgi:hypothetical protein
LGWGWKVSVGEEEGNGVLDGSVFSNRRKERGGWGFAWHDQVEEKMRGVLGRELRRRGWGSSDRWRQQPVG